MLCSRVARGVAVVLGAVMASGFAGGGALAQEEAPLERAPLRVQVLDAEGRPRQGVRVVGYRLRGQEAAVRGEAVARGDDAIAVLPWSVGEDGAVELHLLVASAEPRRVIDLARAAPGPVPMRLPPVGALRIEFTRADGSPLPAALRSSLSVETPLATSRIAARAEVLQAALEDGVAVLQPVALGAECTLHARGVDLPPRRERPLDAGERVVRWPFPADTVFVVGKLRPPPPVGGSRRLAVQVGMETQSRGYSVRTGADGSFAVALPADFAGTLPCIDLRELPDGGPVRLPPLRLQTGDNDLGVVLLPAPTELLAGRIELDGEPPPPGFVLAWTPLGGEQGQLPLAMRPIAIGAGGAFRIDAAVAGLRAIRLACPDRRFLLAEPCEYAPGTRGVVVRIATRPVLSLDVLVDDPALADARWLVVALRRRSDGREFGSPLAPKVGAADRVQATWHAVGGDDFTVRARLVATGEVLHDGGDGVAIEGPSLQRSRELAPLDLRGRLHALRVLVDAPPTRGARHVYVRRSGGKEWRALGNGGQRFDTVVGGPVDLALVDDDLWLERASGVLGECRLIPQPAAAVRVRLRVPPPPLPGHELRVRAIPPADEFARMGAGWSAAAIGADGSAVVHCNRPGAWALRLEAVPAGGRPVELGDPVPIEIRAREPREIEIPAPDYGVLRR